MRWKGGERGWLLLHIDYHIGCLRRVESYDTVPIHGQIELTRLQLWLIGVGWEMRRAREVDETGRVYSPCVSRMSLGWTEDRSSAHIRPRS